METENARRTEGQNRIAPYRCGPPKRTPLCTGSHASVLFRDGTK
jgi:CDGSH-type Zn-finger protein